MILVYTCEGMSSFSLNPCQMRAIAHVGGLLWELGCLFLKVLVGQHISVFLLFFLAGPLS
jgi:hypothetical protein